MTILLQQQLEARILVGILILFFYDQLTYVMTGSSVSFKSCWTVFSHIMLRGCPGVFFWVLPWLGVKILAYIGLRFHLGNITKEGNISGDRISLVRLGRRSKSEGQTYLLVPMWHTHVTHYANALRWPSNLIMMWKGSKTFRFAHRLCASRTILRLLQKVAPKNEPLPNYQNTVLNRTKPANQITCIRRIKVFIHHAL